MCELAFSLKIQSVEAIWNFEKEQGTLDLVSGFGAQRACFEA
jgi:hypothetical protein